VITQFAILALCIRFADGLATRRAIKSSQRDSMHLLRALLRFNLWKGKTGPFGNRAWRLIGVFCIR